MPPPRPSLLTRGYRKVRRRLASAFIGNSHPPVPEPAWFRRDFEEFTAQSAKTAARFALTWEDRHLCVNDCTEGTPFDRHYIYHAAWAARVLSRIRPTVHVDIASSLYFTALVSAFVPIRFYDCRPADLHLDQVTAGAADLTALPFADASIESLSCMHVLEHVGLGRYGDALNSEGDLQAMAELQRVLAHQGHLLIVVPVGRPRICFNAHRIYSRSQVLATFAGLTLVESALIPDHASDGHLIVNPPDELWDAQQYGCGCFWFRRDPTPAAPASPRPA